MRLDSLPLTVPSTPSAGPSQNVRDLREKYVQIGGPGFTGSLTIEVSLNNGADFHLSGAAITATGIVSIPEPATHVRVVVGSLTGAPPTACINGYNARTDF